MTFQTFPGEDPRLEQRRLEAEVLAERREWIRHLELERWTTSRQDPAAAIEQLVVRELYTAPDPYARMPRIA